MTDYSYIGVGKIYARVSGAAAPLTEIGNCSALAFAVAEETRELKDYTQAGGGTYNEVRRVESVEASLTLHDLSPENLAKALFGDANAFTATPVTDEAHVAYAGGFIPTNKPPASITAVTTTDGLTTYVLDTDYSVVPGGIVIIDGGAIVNASNIHIDYTPKAGSAVEALLNSAQEYELFFSGLNEARSGKAVTVHAYRVKLGAAANLALIGEDYAALELTGKVLKDTSKNGTTVSQYFKVSVEA